MNSKKTTDTTEKREYVPRFVTDMDAKLREYPAVTPAFMAELREAFLAAEGDAIKKQQ